MEVVADVSYFLLMTNVTTGHPRHCSLANKHRRCISSMLLLMRLKENMLIFACMTWSFAYLGWQCVYLSGSWHASKAIFTVAHIENSIL